MPEVSYIVNSDKPYPHWIKEHRVFKALPKIDKIFPRIGLPNFTEEITVYSTEAAKANARQVVYFAQTEINNRLTTLRALFLKEIVAPASRERNSKCNDLQNIINILSIIYNAVAGKELTSVVEGKVVMTLPTDVFSGTSSTPLFKKGEGLLKVLAKINSILNDIDPTTSLKINWESNHYFKEFSKFNLPNKEYKLTFSSTGPDGAWDIATASMRGIASCQSWTAAQSRGLIGSISSKYVGVIFISGATDYPPYGKQMMFRSLIRLVIHRETGAPALYMDTMYPSYNADIYNTIKEIIEARSGLKVFSSSAGDKDYIMREYHLLNEPSRAYLREGEYSYMDSVLKVENRKVPVLIEPENRIFYTRRSFFIERLEKIIAEKRTAYIKNVKELKEYLASEKKDEGKKPEIVPAFQDLKKGQYSFQNTLNFFAHCDRVNSTTNHPTTYFLTEIFKTMDSSGQTFNTARDCDIWILRNLISNYATIKEKSWTVLSTGTWMKAFPASAKRFHETVITDLKKELLLSCKANT